LEIKALARLKAQRTGRKRPSGKECLSVFDFVRTSPTRWETGDSMSWCPGGNEAKWVGIRCRAKGSSDEAEIQLGLAFHLCFSCQRCMAGGCSNNAAVGAVGEGKLGIERHRNVWNENDDPESQSIVRAGRVRPASPFPRDGKRHGGGHGAHVHYSLGPGPLAPWPWFAQGCSPMPPFPAGVPWPSGC
jgi:hypothetical protein